MKVALVGAAGQLGLSLQRIAPPTLHLVTYDRKELDVGDECAVHDALTREQPDLVINAAGYTQVDRAEAEPEAADRTNRAGAAHVAAAAAAVAARLIHVSTDYVFAGDRPVPYAPEDATRPESTYGRTKLEGERAVLEIAGGAATIVRTSWLYASRGLNFVLTMLRLMRAGEPIRVVSDRIGSPTWAGSLSRAIWRMADRDGLAGIQHWSDAGVASWYDLAVAIQEEALTRRLVSEPVSVVPISSDEYPTAARRPRYSVLDTRHTAAALGMQPPHWRESLRSMLDELAHA